jgi:hypothetical protein
MVMVENHHLNVLVKPIICAYSFDKSLFDLMDKVRIIRPEITAKIETSEVQRHKKNEASASGTYPKKPR